MKVEKKRELFRDEDQRITSNTKRKEKETRRERERERERAHLDGEDEDAADADHVDEEDHGLVLVRRVRVEDAARHHGAGGLVQHQHVHAASSTLVGVVHDLRGQSRSQIP